jgi:diguanylate cyclase (GGDEF)-like protein/PAS domain S-box-containing protein
MRNATQPTQHAKNRPIAKFKSLKNFIPFLSRISRLEDELELLTTNSSDTVYRLRYNSMSYDYVSPSIVKLLGFTPEEMMAMNFRSLIIDTKLISNGLQSVMHYGDLEEARRRGDVSKWQADYLIRTKDGRKIWITDISYPWFNERGDIIGSIGSLRDITDRVRAEQLIKDELIRLAHTDPLTGIANRRHFFEKVEEELKRIKRSGSEFSILLIDVDHFKKINDIYGHDVGDKMLTEIATLIQSCLRETDLCARIGGEEFSVFLPDTQENGAFWVADRICSRIAKHSFFVADGKTPMNLTVSIGVAGANSSSDLTSAQLYKNADTRLYIAKHTGRNQVSADEIVHLH